MLVPPARDYKPPKPVVGDKQTADPAEPVIKGFMARPTTTSKN